MPGDLPTEAVAALRLAAERLGVDPFRLARFLGEGRLGDILESLGRPGYPADDARRLELAEEYLQFLDGEMELQGGKRRGQRHNGA